MNAPRRRWPVHPPPLHDETLLSWVIRTARGNASNMTSWMAAVAGHYDNGLHLDRVENPALWALLADGAGLSGVEAVRALTLLDVEAQLSAHGASRWLLSIDERVTRNKHRFCPLCIASDPLPYLRRAWRLEWVRWCPVHACRMAEGCLRCGEPFAPWKRHWDVLFNSCWNCERDVASPTTRKESDRVQAPRFVMDAIRESVAALRDGAAGTEHSPFPVVWSLQKWIDSVGQNHWPEWVDVLGIGDSVEGTPPTPSDAVTWSFALAWHLRRASPEVLEDLVARHQATFNRAMTHRCPEVLAPLVRKVFDLKAFDAVDVEEAVKALIDANAEVTYLAVAEALGVSPGRIGSNSVMREIVDRATPIMRKRWVDGMRDKLRQGQERLKAQSKRVSRLNLAKIAKVSLEGIARFEKETGETFAISPSSQYAAEVEGAIARMRERHERISAIGVARELKRDRSFIEKDPELKTIIKAAMLGKPTEAEIRSVCRKIGENDEKLPLTKIAEALHRRREVFQRDKHLLAIIEEERERATNALAEKTTAAVRKMCWYEQPPSYSAVSRALGKPRSFVGKREWLTQLVYDVWFSIHRAPYIKW